MPDFNAKMHQNHISAGAPPQTPLGELTPLPSPLDGFKGPTSKERGGEVRGGDARPVCLLVLTILATGLS